MKSEPVSPSTGVGVLHLFCKPTPMFEAEAAVAAVKEAESAGCQVVTISMLGHKCDVAVMAIHENLRELRALQTAVQHAGLDIVEGNETALDDKTACFVVQNPDFTGAIRDITPLSDAAHAKGALVVWDLSHSAGNMSVELNACDADFAVGCGYKYLNGGPGAPAYVFVAKHHQHEFDHPLTGWLGHADPFAFAPEYVPARGMNKLLTGTPPILSLLALDAALDVFDGVDMRQVRAKTESLTQLFVDLAGERLLRHGFTLASPREAKHRGGQVSLSHREGYAIMQALIARGVIGDYRAPDTVRFGFAPLYTRHIDVYDAVAVIDDVMTNRAWDTPAFKARKAVT